MCRNNGVRLHDLKVLVCTFDFVETFLSLKFRIVQKDLKVTRECSWRLRWPYGAIPSMKYFIVRNLYKL